MGPGAREQLARVARMRPLLTYGLSFFAVQTLLELGRAYLWLKDKYDPAVIGGHTQMGNGGEAATWFSQMSANARPARRAGPIVRPPRFRPEWADDGGPRHPRGGPVAALAV